MMYLVVGSFGYPITDSTYHIVLYLHMQPNSIPRSIPYSGTTSSHLPSFQPRSSCRLPGTL